MAAQMCNCIETSVAAQTQASFFDMAAVQSLVMKIHPSNAAANGVAANAGHPHLGLWLASGSHKPLIITIRPSWFADGSALYTFIPGETDLSSCSC